MPVPLPADAFLPSACNAATNKFVLLLDGVGAVVNATHGIGGTGGPVTAEAVATTGGNGECCAISSDGVDLPKPSEIGRSEGLLAEDGTMPMNFPEGLCASNIDLSTAAAFRNEYPMQVSGQVFLFAVEKLSKVLLGDAREDDEMGLLGDSHATFNPTASFCGVGDLTGV